MKHFSGWASYFFHAGVDIHHLALSLYPERLLHVIQAFPEGNIIAAHMGGYNYWDEVENISWARIYSLIRHTLQSWKQTA